MPKHASVEKPSPSHAALPNSNATEMAAVELGEYLKKGSRNPGRVNNGFNPAGSQYFAYSVSQMLTASDHKFSSAGANIHRHFIPENFLSFFLQVNAGFI